MKKKLGLALGAGGARGVAHVGFLHALDEAGIRADCVTGCSMGSIVGACYCAGVPMQTIRSVMTELKLSRIASLNVNALRASGLFRLNKARKLLEEYIGADTTFADLAVPFRCVATDLLSGRTVCISEGNVIDAIIASSSVPGAFSPVERDGMLLVDGGVIERVPVRELKSMGAETIVAVDVLGNLVTAVSKPPANLIETFLRYIDVIDTRVTQSKRRSRMKDIDLWLEPELGDMDQYKVKNLEFACRKGYELGRANVGKIKELIGE